MVFNGINMFTDQNLSLISNSIVEICQEIFNNHLLYVGIHGSLASNPLDYDDIDFMVITDLPYILSDMEYRAILFEQKLTKIDVIPCTKHRIRNHLEMVAVNASKDNLKFSVHFFSLDIFLPLMKIGKEYNIFKVDSIFQHEVHFQLKARHGFLETIDIYHNPSINIVKQLKSKIKVYPEVMISITLEDMELEKSLVEYNLREAQSKKSEIMYLVAKSQCFDLIIRRIYTINRTYLGNLKYLSKDILSFSNKPIFEQDLEVIIKNDPFTVLEEVFKLK
jgi:hypothetical protein